MKFMHFSLWYNSPRIILDVFNDMCIGLIFKLIFTKKSFASPHQSCFCNSNYLTDLLQVTDWLNGIHTLRWSQG